MHTCVVKSVIDVFKALVYIDDSVKFKEEKNTFHVRNVFLAAM